MPLDQFINFGDAEVDATGYNSSATSVNLAPGHGARWAALTPPFNATWYNYTDYPNPSDDPNVEIVTVTARTTDALTVTRGQESITATAKNAVGKTYRMLPTLTAKTMTEIGTFFDGWDSTNNYLGIGLTGAPAQRLVVRHNWDASTSTIGSDHEVVRAVSTTVGAGDVSTPHIGISSSMTDDSPTNKTITNAAASPVSPLIRITATGHGYATGDAIGVYGVTGTTEANGAWDITVIDANTFDLQGSTFANAYVSGGTATNRSQLVSFRARVTPSLDRSQAGTGSAFNDDANCYTGANTGTAKATDAFYLGASPSVASGPAWVNAFATDADSNYFFRATGVAYTAGIDLTQATYDGTAPAIAVGSGGTAAHYLYGSGRAQFNTTDAQASTTDAAGTARITNFLASHTLTDSGFTSPIQSNAFITHLDFASDPGSKAVNNLLSFITTASDAVAQASLTLRCFAPTVQHNGTGTLGTALANAGTVTNATSGTITTARGSSGTVTNSSTGTISTAEGFRSAIANSNASGTVTTASGVVVAITNSGTITNTFGVYVQDISAGTQTNTPYSFFGADADAPSNFNHTVNIGGGTLPNAIAVRGTTEGTNQLKIFDGTAPVGTLTNGISLYSTAGELRVMDAAGNATLLSPHEKGTNYWIYDSVLTTTGKSLRIDVERILRFINEHHGLNAIHEVEGAHA